MVRWRRLAGNNSIVYVREHCYDSAHTWNAINRYEYTVEYRKKYVVLINIGKAAHLNCIENIFLNIFNKLCKWQM